MVDFISYKVPVAAPGLTRNMAIVQSRITERSTLRRRAAVLMCVMELQPNG